MNGCTKRFIDYNIDQNYMIPLDTTKAFPEGSYPRFIVQIIEQCVNEITFYPDETDKGGAAAHNPKAILSLLFYGFSQGVFSCRKIAHACEHDITYMFLSGFSTPDHSTISRFMQKFPDQISDIFSKVLYIGVNLGYVDYKLTATDGTKIIANASEYFSGTIEDFEKRVKKLKKRIDRLLEKSRATEDQEDKADLEQRIEKLEKISDKISTFLEDTDKITKKDGKEVKQNITDKDARTMRLNGKGYKPGYNGQVTVDVKNGLVVASDITNQANDINQFKPMMELTEKLAPPQWKEEIKNAIHLADNGYDSVDNMIYAQAKGLNILVAPGTTKDLFRENPQKENKEETIGSKHCKKEKTATGYRLTCPGGQVLTAWLIRMCKGDTQCEFTIENLELCMTCPFFNDCVGKLKDPRKKTFRIKKEILDNLDLIQDNHTKIRSEEGKKLYSKRMGAVEKVFGHIKENLGFRRMLVRGQEKVGLAWNMICTTYNLQRIFNLMFPDRQKTVCT